MIMKKTWDRQILLSILCAAIVLTGYILVTRVHAKARSEKEITREIVYAYYSNQDLSTKRMDNLMQELEQVNPDAPKKWKQILTCWGEAKADMPVNYVSLPSELEDGKQLCLAVLGFQLNPDGTMKQELEDRLNIALLNAEAFQEAYILCTGGGTASGARDVTEADVMAQWLMEQGIDKDRIIVENRSVSTNENVLFSYDILRRDYPEITELAIISSDYHIPWAQILFQTKFILEGSPIRVVSNAVCKGSEVFNKSSLLRLQMTGILEISGCVF